MIPESAQYRRLRRLWTDHRAAPFPSAGTQDPRFQEIALYESWLGSLAESALEKGGRLVPAHRAMLDVRLQEGDRSLWSLAGELGEPVRSYVARLLAIQAVLASLPVDSRQG